MNDCVIVCVEKKLSGDGSSRTYLWVDGAFCSKLRSRLTDARRAYKKTRFATEFLYILPEKHYKSLWRKKNLRISHGKTLFNGWTIYLNKFRSKATTKKKQVTPHIKSCFRSLCRSYFVYRRVVET